MLNNTSPSKKLVFDEITDDSAPFKDEENKSRKKNNDRFFPVS